MSRLFEALAQLDEIVSGKTKYPSGKRAFKRFANRVASVVSRTGAQVGPVRTVAAYYVEFDYDGDFHSVVRRIKDVFKPGWRYKYRGQRPVPGEFWYYYGGYLIKVEPHKVRVKVEMPSDTNIGMER